MSRTHSAHDLEQLKKLAKTLLKSARVGDPRVTIRFDVLGLAPGSISNEASSSDSDESPIESADANVSQDPHRQWKLADAQLMIAREKGFESWKKLRRFIEDHVADDFFAAVSEGRLRKVKLLLDEFPKLSFVRNNSGPAANPSRYSVWTSRSSRTFTRRCNTTIAEHVAISSLRERKGTSDLGHDQRIDHRQS